MKSNCIITIKIGDKEIQLDPGANISQEDFNVLAKTMPADKLRELYSDLKSNITLDDILKSNDANLINAGKEYYQSLINDTKDKFLTILKAIQLEKDPERLKELITYASSLDPKEKLTHGNFMIDPQDSYKSSPYSPDQIKNLVFSKVGDKVQLFNDLLKLPGMESVKMSIAYASEWNNDPKFTKVGGAYISPDNIVQIVLPPIPTHIIKGVPSKVLTINQENITKTAKAQVQDVLIHELLHAVYSELYRSNSIFKKQIDNIYDKAIQEKPELTKKYGEKKNDEGKHEFIASIFNDGTLQNLLTDIPSEDGNVSLFDSFTNLLNKDKNGVVPGITKPTLLRDFINIISAKIPIIGSKELLDTVAANEAIQDDRNIFYIGGSTPIDDEENMSPNDQTDTKYGNNRKAFYANQRFNEKWGDNSFKRDSYFKGTESDPKPARLDILRPDDVIIIPWVNYVKATQVNGVKIPGYYQEVGGVMKEIVGKDGKPKLVPVMKGDKLAPPVPIIRDENGKIQKTKEGYIVEERTQAFPVIYPNINSQHITVAKTTLKINDEFRPIPIKGKSDSSSGYNTISFPYSLIKGVRELDRSYFDHNTDYTKQLNDTKAELTKVEKLIAKLDPKNTINNEKLFDDQQFLTNRVKKLPELVQKAADIKAQIKDLYKTYIFEHNEGGKTYMNVAKHEYIGYRPNVDVTNHEFRDSPAFKLWKHPTLKTIDGKPQWYVAPNTNIFDVFWDGDVAKDYARHSEQLSNAISAGDLVRSKGDAEFPIAGTDIMQKVKLNRWYTVVKRVANGIQVATQEGQGMIIPFNMVNAYAKNKRTNDYQSMLSDYKQQVIDFNDDAFININGKTTYSSEIKGKKLINPPIQRTNSDGQPIETEEESSVRFDNNLDLIKSRIQPGESFVRISKRYTNDSGKTVTYPLNGLVLAKTDDALIVFTAEDLRSSTHDPVTIIQTIKYDSRLTPESGLEITHVMENTAHARRAYEEFAAERGKYETNKQTANFEAKEGGGYTMLNDPRDNPHNIRQQYDFYEATTDDGRIDGKMLKRLGESGGIIDIKDPRFNMIGNNGTRIPIYRKVMRVLDDGTVVIASRANKDIQVNDNFTRKAGDYFASYVRPENIARIGLNIGKLSKDPKTQEIHSDMNEELLNRRKWLFERTKADRDFNNFTFAKTMQDVKGLNSKPINLEQNYWRFIPLTNIILDPLTKEQMNENEKEGRDRNYDPRPTKFLDKNFNEVEPDKAAYVKATMHKNSEDLYYVHRGVMTKSTFINPRLAIVDTQFGKRFRPELIKALKPGDWVQYRTSSGAPFDAVIERTEGGNIYTLNTDMTTSQVTPSKVTAIRMSYRNDIPSGFKRSRDLETLLKQKAQIDDANSSIKQSRDNNGTQSKDTPFSLDAQYKSPKSSIRALRTIGNRLQELNPEVQLNYVDNQDLQELQKTTNYDYSNSRAFVLKGQVYINTDKASISDQIHEYAHLFLNSLKYENPKLYSAIVGVTKNHSLFDNIAIDYSHLEGDDLNEEAFVTILGEYLHGKLLSKDQQNMDSNQDLLLGFAQYTKDKLTQALNKEVTSIYDIDAKEILTLPWEDVINLVGDHVMNNKITDVYDQYPISDTKDVNLLKNELRDKGYLTQQC